uniref:General transcription factor IIF subunit 2 n=1 Tax=Caligus clemensi TaxID=344056 RepID=C1BZX1_CALCM|nr:Transcription initiation factor IIF subunit beta [Caligus clemensi]
MSAPPAKISDKDLFTENRKRGVWLVKVPKYISDRWEKAPDNEVVGKLRIVKRARAKPDVSFSLDDKIVAKREGTPESKTSTNQAIPKQHKFIVSNVMAQTLGVFSRLTSSASEGPDRVSLEGRVVKKAECRPISDKTYMSVKREAILKAIEPTRQTVQLDRAVNHYKPISNHAANIEHARRKKEEGKKSRDDKEKVMERLFALFEKHQYYNIKDLVRETRQPITHLKEVLKGVCNYNLKNPHKNMWELKPEYRHYKVDEEAKEKKGNESSSDDED